MPLEREKIYIYGKHALMEALTGTPHAIKKVFLSREAVSSEPELEKLLKKHRITIEIMRGPRDAERMVGAETAHQGVIAVASPAELTIDFKSFAQKLVPTENTLFVLLDELTDPHNVGAIIRSAAAFGASGVLIPSHNQAPITGAVVKASAGMVFRMPVISIGNINYTIDTLKDMNFATYALTASGSRNVNEEPFENPSLLIVGNEGKGIRQKTLERADVKLRIPIDPRCESLNASVSAAVVLYQWSMRRKPQ